MILRHVGEIHIFKHRVYILALEQARVLIGKYVLLGVINTIYKHCYAWVILWNAAKGSIFLDYGLNMSALGHVMKLILCSYVLLVFINRICKHYYAWVILHNVWEVWIPEHGYIPALTQASVLIWSKNIRLWFTVWEGTRGQIMRPNRLSHI